jgi:hypothetical protein
MNALSYFFDRSLYDLQRIIGGCRREDELREPRADCLGNRVIELLRYEHPVISIMRFPEFSFEQAVGVDVLAKLAAMAVAKVGQTGQEARAQGKYRAIKQVGETVRIPIEAGRLFRRDVGHHSDLKPATIPI